jgi:hypothetical protein
VRKSPTTEATPNTISDTKAMTAKSSCCSTKFFETPAIFSTVSSVASPVKYPKTAPIEEIMKRI